MIKYNALLRKTRNMANGSDRRAAGRVYTVVLT